MMKFVTEDKNQRIIKGQEEITFSSLTSYHLIILRARAKGEKQISESSTDDEDLTIQIDDKKFPSPTSINGGSLHNLSKTVYLLTFLQGKNHKLILNTDDPPGTATFEKITQPLLGDPLEKQAWQESYKVAEFVFFGKESDPTKGANHFYVPSDQPKQDWVDEKKFTVQIGATRFYKL